MLGDQRVLEARTVGRLDHADVLEEHVVLRVRIPVTTELRHVALDEDPELHWNMSSPLDN